MYILHKNKDWKILFLNKNMRLWDYENLQPCILKLSIIISILIEQNNMKIYEANLKMVENSAIDSFNLLKKGFHVFIINDWSIDRICWIRINFSDYLFKIIVLWALLHQINLLNCQKNCSTGANSEVYCWRKIHEHCDSLR